MIKIFISKVQFKINGDLDETGVRTLNEDKWLKKLTLKRSSVDSFLMSVRK